MKKFIHATTDTKKHLSGCRFDFDLGHNYNLRELENRISSVLIDNCGVDVTGFDVDSVEYPDGLLYSQGGIDFEWSTDYDPNSIEEAIGDIITDMGGEFLGIDFYSEED